VFDPNKKTDAILLSVDVMNERLNGVSKDDG
jgi:hypothetical protein